MWIKRDWHQFYIETNKHWERLRPPRPVHRTDSSRLAPAEGFSVRELNDAGITLDRAERLGLPVDMGRQFSYAPNVDMLRDFVRATRRFGQ